MSNNETQQLANISTEGDKHSSIEIEGCSIRIKSNPSDDAVNKTRDEIEENINNSLPRMQDK
jgi:hypothetical protein